MFICCPLIFILVTACRLTPFLERACSSGCCFSYKLCVIKVKIVTVPVEPDAGCYIHAKQINAKHCDSTLDALQPACAEHKLCCNNMRAGLQLQLLFRLQQFRRAFSSTVADDNNFIDSPLHP